MSARERSALAIRLEPQEQILKSMSTAYMRSKSVSSFECGVVLGEDQLLTNWRPCRNVLLGGGCGMALRFVGFVAKCRLGAGKFIRLPVLASLIGRGGTFIFRILRDGAILV